MQVNTNLYVANFNANHSIDNDYLDPKPYAAHGQTPSRVCLVRWKTISERVQQIINEIAKKNGFKNPTPHKDSKIQIVLTWNSHPSADRVKKSICIPYTYLFHARELPPQFHHRSENDPRLYSKPFLRKATKWAIQKVHKDLELPIPAINEQTLKCGVSLMQEHLLLSVNPQLYKQAIDFSICHEVGHVYDYFYKPLSSPSTWKSKTIVLLSLSLIGGVTCRYGLFYGITTSYCLHLTSGFIIKHKEKLFSQTRLIEKQDKCEPKKSYTYLEEQIADELAIRAFPENALGAIHYFRIFEKIQKLNHLDLSPEEVDSDHPTPGERIQFIRSQQNKAS